MPKVLVSDKLSPTAVQIFKDNGVEVDYLPDLGKDKEKFLEAIGQYDGLAIRSASKVTEKIIAAATNLKVIGRAGIGVDNVDIPAATKKGIIVMNTPFGNSITTAEHAIAMMFALARQLPEADASTRASKWEKNRFMGVEVTNKTLGLIGAGNIGSIVADRAIGPRNAPRRWVSRRSSSMIFSPAPISSRCTRRSSMRPAIFSMLKTSPRPRRACASSIAPVAVLSMRKRSTTR
jgi:D-3-phosphoglycerate dehydrogenase